jgi:two-component system phosphate regulon sensor histidine kinase PhoR
MFKSNLIFKFSFLILIVLILSVTLQFVFNAGLTSIIISSIILIVTYVIALYFFNREIIRPMSIFSFFSKEIYDTDKKDESADFEEKLTELNKVNELLSEHLNKNKYNDDVNDIFYSLQLTTERLTNELNTAKIFKVNRNEFLGNVAHELRTPIFAIQLSLETLLDGAINDEKVNMDFLNRAMNQVNRLKVLVDDLIAISKFETGIRMSKRYFDFNEYVKNIISEMRSLAENKNIDLKFETNLDNEIQVFGDSESLKQVFINLIDNAIKYTAEDGIIVVKLTDAEKNVSISVLDNGIGIPKKDLARIFERFYRVDKNRSRDRGGSGLGLSIVKHILEAHNTQIKVESEENKGTKFEFVLQK